MKRLCTLVALAAVFLQAITPPRDAAAKDLIQKVFHMQKPPTAEDPSVEELAEQIDWLEKHLDAYGTIVPKQPDVWGQARLTQHRQEYELLMYQQLNKFELFLQGTVFQSDQAFLANAFALQQAAAAGPKPAKTHSGLLGLRGPTTTVSLQTASSTPVATGGSSGGYSSSGPPQVASLIGDPNTFFASAPFNPTTNFQLSPDSTMQGKIGIEPTLALAQRDRYLEYLHELRRRNEGDDTADSPGYALNLVRVPLSILPGKRTYRGYGAEIECTMRPHLSPALLPTTFRNLVINDVVDQLCLPITRIADEMRNELQKLDGLQKEIDQLDEQRQASDKEYYDISLQLRNWADAPKQLLDEAFDPSDSQKRQGARSAIEASPKTPAPKSPNGPTGPGNGAPNFREAFDRLDYLDRRRQIERQSTEKRKKDRRDELNRKTEEIVNSLSSSVGVASSTANRMRQARDPVPPSQVGPVFGNGELAYTAASFIDAYNGPNVIWNDDGINNHVMYLDVQRYLQAEVEAAYELLARPEAEPLWNDPGFPIMAIPEVIRAGRFHELCRMRDNFFRAIQHPSGKDLLQTLFDVNPPDDECDEQVVKALAWALFVESALLNHQLIVDIRDSALAKGCDCGCASAEGIEFYRPHPDPAACEAFNKYVLCRWPIHVFALQPSEEMQNIGSVSSRRSELQMALSLGFVQGQISAQNLMKYSRQLDTEIQTVDLNYTQIGFSHGADSFGWRFAPRLQPLVVKGTVQNVFTTLFGAQTQEDDLLQRRIEPGIRECVAIVIMPSFVPYVTLETRASWFRLNAKSGWLPTRHAREMSMVDAMKLSRSVQSMHHMVEQLNDPCAYRPGDVELMRNRIYQLNEQLPMQHMIVQVPIENTLGGYQMFNNGVTDLAPELHGWYGAPGILVSKNAPPPASKGCSSCSAKSSDSSDTTQSTCQQSGQQTSQQSKTTTADPPCPDSMQDSTPSPSAANTAANGKGSGNAKNQTGAQTTGQTTGNTTTPSTKDTASTQETASAKLADEALKLAGQAMDLTTKAAAASAAAAKTKTAKDYPAPPDCCCSGTTVFLVGNHFSVVSTRVIAGGVCIPSDAVRMLSRQVMEVTIPSNVQYVTINSDDGLKWIDVHVATPYGVTGHLHIPVVWPPCAKKETAPPPSLNTVSPLGVKLGSDKEVDIAPSGTSFIPFGAPGSITLECLDANVCDAYNRINSYNLVAYIYNGGTGPIAWTGGLPLTAGPHATPVPSGGPAPMTMFVDKTDLEKAICAVLKPAMVGDQTNAKLTAQLYLVAKPPGDILNLITKSGPSLADMHVDGELTIKLPKAATPSTSHGPLPSPADHPTKSPKSAPSTEDGSKNKSGQIPQRSQRDIPPQVRQGPVFPGVTRLPPTTER